MSRSNVLLGLVLSLATACGERNLVVGREVLDSGDGDGSNDGAAGVACEGDRDALLVAVASVGDDHACVVTVDDDVLCWGQNREGQIGAGDPADSSARELLPIAPVGLPQARVVAAGDDHSCAITLDGDLYCWGENEGGQLGTNGPLQSENPVTLVSAGFSTVATSWDHSCAIRASDDHLLCWGVDENGGVGIDGDDSPVLVPTEVELSSGDPLVARAVSAGGEHTCAITLEDELYCWGMNSDGQLGTGDEESSSVPVLVDDSREWVSVVLGHAHSCAIDADGVLYCWGANTDLQLGSDADDPTLVPTEAPLGAPCRSVALGDDHTCAVTMIGELDRWGTGRGLGQDSSDSVFGEPHRLLADETWAAVYSNTTNVCALNENGSLWCWGTNEDGQVGLGDESTSEPPSQLCAP